jgi:hypothetical protein
MRNKGQTKNQKSAGHSQKVLSNGDSVEISRQKPPKRSTGRWTLSKIKDSKLKESDVQRVPGASRIGCQGPLGKAPFSCDFVRGGGGFRVHSLRVHCLPLHEASCISPLLVLGSE